MLFDTHCHINDSAYDTDRPDRIGPGSRGRRRLDAVPGNGYGYVSACIDLANGHDGVYAAVGIHPELAATATPDDAAKLRQWVRGEQKVVAIGEVA